MNKSLVGAVAVAALGLAAAGCSSSSTNSTTTTAARSTSTTVAKGTPPTTVPTNNAPAGGASATDVGQAFIQAVGSQSPSTFCSTYAQPSDQGACQRSLSQLTGSAITIKHLALGKVVTEGSRAVINFTASICSGSTCQTISDPNSAMAHGVTFDQAYAQAASPTATGSNTVLSGAASEQNGRWYAVGF